MIEKFGITASNVARLALLATICGQAAAGQSPTGGLPISSGQQALPDLGAKTGQTVTGAVGAKDTPATGKGSGAPGLTKPANTGAETASPHKLALAPTAPSVPPPNLPKHRPVIGLALGGGAAIALSEVGALQWFDEHRIPIDVIAGTSMGSILAALYSTGKTPEQMKGMLNGNNVSNIFRIGAAYSNLSFDSREADREVPNAINIGLKHGVSLRNSLLTDIGLNDLLDKEFLNYNDQTDFNNLPIPFRCQATDITSARTVTFARGSLPDAVRASASIPGIFRPFQMNGHEYVDGAILENLPTPDIKAMNADVIIAVSLPLAPVAPGQLDSIVGVLQRAFSVGIEANEREERKLANIVIIPDVKGFTASDYLSLEKLAVRGYAAAEAHKAELLPYALSEEEYKSYLAVRRSRERPPAGTVLRVKVTAPSPGVREYTERKFAPLVGHPVDTAQIDNLLADVRADGRYNADYTVGYDETPSNRPILLVTINGKNTGPPFLDVGLNVAAQISGVTHAGISSVLLYPDLGGFGSSFRANVDLGYVTRAQAEYLHKLNPFTPFFFGPRANITREPFYIYQGNYRISQRQSQFGGVGADVGWGDGRKQELRAGWNLQNVQWYTTTGHDTLPDFYGNAQTARVKYIYDTSDGALVPHYGIRSDTSVGYLFATHGSPGAPQLGSQLQYVHQLGFLPKKYRSDVFLMDAQGGTMFNRNVAQPFRFTLGGPLRLSSLSIDQLRGTDYFLVTPGYLHRVIALPAPINGAVYVALGYEAGQMRSPDGATTTQQDIYLGVISETPLGVITLGPSFGNNGQRKFLFTLGRFFSTPSALR